ncbi:universal stress protein [Actinomadura sp. WMMA1423]|uniref:universal stress protein n=1 Tax=Actinomadura sp. WMMA1423 TaxID=2591108 RepID=UPI0011464674|nr:universal stress protein [Actinomadura sp. WMMA1423]
MNDHERTDTVLVGYDGSPAADEALRWGVREARFRRLPLTVCHAWHWPYPLRLPDKDTLEVLRGAGAIVADEGVRKAHNLAEGLDVRWRLDRGWASAVLLEASRDAAVVVLGSRGHGGFEGLSVGSTAVQVASHAVRPVIVVRPDLPPARPDRERVVVGVDGSTSGESAIGFAFDEAALRGASVTAVCSWWDPAAFRGPDRVPFSDPQVVRHEAMARFEEDVAPWRSRYPRVTLETEFVVDTPRRALVSASEGATLLVMGARGIGSGPQTLLGPVTQTALQEAPCPVAVVPAQGAGRGRAAETAGASTRGGTS